MTNRRTGSTWMNIISAEAVHPLVTRSHNTAIPDSMLFNTVQFEIQIFGYDARPDQAIDAR